MTLMRGRPPVADRRPREAAWSHAECRSSRASARLLACRSRRSSPIPQLGKPNIPILVAERGAEVLGYTCTGVEGRNYMALRGPAGVLHDIVVDPAHRAQGVGRMLLDATLEALRARGAPRVVLSTAEKNGFAQRLFARAGFRRTMIEMTRELERDAG
jgi:ribosomal protein S18 acetylase RimI-like enzyme